MATLEQVTKKNNIKTKATHNLSGFAFLNLVSK
jgi:hypothetical protein